jgi:hypothetical protein
MKELTRDEPRRLELLGIKEPIYGGGIAGFRDLKLATLKILLDEGFIDPMECQNNAPSVAEMYLLGEELEELGSKVSFHGYAVEPERGDYRISLEGVFMDDPSPAAVARFASAFRDADEFDVDDISGYCWYD